MRERTVMLDLMKKNVGRFQVPVNDNQGSHKSTETSQIVFELSLWTPLIINNNQ
jgi:hypothetical protein